MINESHCAKKRAQRSGHSRVVSQPNEAFVEIAQQAQLREKFRWALVFGNEESGLSTAETDHCSALMTLECNPANPSINLAMAIGLLSYHWRIFQQHSKVEFIEKAAEEAAPTCAQADVEKFLTYVKESLNFTQFFMI